MDEDEDEEEEEDGDEAATIAAENGEQASDEDEGVVDGKREEEEDDSDEEDEQPELPSGLTGTLKRCLLDFYIAFMCCPSIVSHHETGVSKGRQKHLRWSFGRGRRRPFRRDRLQGQAASRLAGR